MTDAQIKDLMHRVNEACYEGEGINVTLEDVMTLISERSLLLTAAKEALRVDLADIDPLEGLQAAVAEVES